jgi:hypothetical protein
VQTSSIDALKGRLHGLSFIRVHHQRQSELLIVLKSHAASASARPNNAASQHFQSSSRRFAPFRGKAIASAGLYTVPVSF